MGTMKYDGFATDYGRHYSDVIGRVGLIYHVNDWIDLKAFSSKTHIFPSFLQSYQMRSLKRGNPYLALQRMYNQSSELIFNHQYGTTHLGASKLRVRTPIKVNAQQFYFSSPNLPAFYRYFISHQYRFNSSDQLQFEYYWTNSSLPNHASSPDGGYIRVLNRIGKMDLFNEVVFKRGYYHTGFNMMIENSYDYSSGVTYQATPLFKVGVKAENIFDKSLKTPMPNLYPIDSVDRRVMVTLEYSY
jgi:hypothetical protein